MANKLMIADVEKTAKLANLKISEEEARKFSTQLGDVISYVKQLDEVNIDDVKPTFQIIDNASNVVREDAVEESLTQEEALSGAKKTYQGYFLTNGVFNE